MSIHSRAAATEVLDAIEAQPAAGIPILHWFSGSQAQLVRAVALGCWFSVGPAMLRSKKGALLAAQMPRDRVLTETDAPFAQNRGSPLMPWDAALAEVDLAKCWHLPGADASHKISLNFRSLTSRAQSFVLLD